ncbi:MAG: caspase family protein [Myxococcota bacterium]
MLDPRTLLDRTRVLAALALAAVGAACAVPLNLPLASQVPPAEPLAIDGLWRLEENQVLFRVDRGRIVATQGYTAVVLGVKADQVVVRDLRQTGPRTFSGFDLTANGAWEGVVGDDRGLDITLHGALGPVKLRMVPVQLDSEPWLARQLAAQSVVARAPSSVPPAPGAPLSAPATTALSAESRVADPSAFGRYHALVIGNDGYRHLPPLRTARNDARAVARLLADAYGFEVELLLDATREQVLLAFSGLRQKLGPEDNLLIYYAGHGWLDADADEGYWLPVDAQPDNPVRWIANSAITAHFRALRAKHVLVVADSCYSGTLTRGIRMTASERNTRDWERLSREKARIVLSSGGEEPVEDGTGSHSAFAAAFLDSLRRNQGVLDTTTLYARIRRPVMLAADQAPDLADIRKAGHAGGDFLFVRREGGGR